MINEPVGLDVIKFINCWWEIYDQQAWAFQLQKKLFHLNKLLEIKWPKYTDVFGNTSMHSKILWCIWKHINVFKIHWCIWKHINAFKNTLMYLETHQCIQKCTDVFGNTSMYSKVHWCDRMYPKIHSSILRW